MPLSAVFMSMCLTSSSVMDPVIHETMDPVFYMTELAGKEIREGQLKPLEVREVFERLRRRRPLLRRHICWIKLDTPVAKADKWS